MNIYQINEAILECIDMETGEIIDLEALEALQIERDEKIDNLASWYKQTCAEAEAIKAEEKSLCERRKAKEAKAESIKGYLSRILNGNKFETSKNKISWRRSESINFLNEDAIPAAFKKEVVEVKIDKMAIKEAIKNGEKVSGAVIEEKNNIQIK
jgi:hypothetical protein